MGSHTRRTTLQHRLVGALTAGAMVLAACSGGSDEASPVVIGDSEAADTTSPTTVAPTTTVAETTTSAPASTTTTAAATTTTTVAPETTTTTVAPTTTTAPPTTTTTAPPPPTTTTTTVAPDPPVPSAPADPSLSAWVGIEEGLPEATGDGVNCLPFYTEMGLVSEQACGPWDSAHGTHVWTVGKTVSNTWFAAVWRNTGGFNWQPSLRIIEPDPLTWSSVTLVAHDIDGGPAEELVAGIRYDGTGGFLSIDVIDSYGGIPTVVAHMPAVEKGVALVADNLGVWVYEADYAPSDPICCPTSFVQSLIASAPGGWVIEEGAVGVPPSALPASQF